MQASEVAVRRRRLAPVTLGTILFISSELMFFAALFGSYFFLRATSDPWPPPEAGGGLRDPLILTAILVSSSATAHLAMASLRARSVQAMTGWLGVTIGLGVLFLAATVRGWLDEPFTVSSHAYGTLFFGITGFHAAHVLVGLLVFLVILGRAAQGAYHGGGEHPGPEAAGYYWHFVDLVWLGVFSTLYLVR